MRIPIEFLALLKPSFDDYLRQIQGSIDITGYEHYINQIRQFENNYGNNHLILYHTTTPGLYLLQKLYQTALGTKTFLPLRFYDKVHNFPKSKFEKSSPPELFDNAFLDENIKSSHDFIKIIKNIPDNYDWIPGVQERLISANINLFGYNNDIGESSWEMFKIKYYAEWEPIGGDTKGSVFIDAVDAFTQLRGGYFDLIQKRMCGISHLLLYRDIIPHWNVGACFAPLEEGSLASKLRHSLQYFPPHIVEMVVEVLTKTPYKLVPPLRQHTGVLHAIAIPKNVADKWLYQSKEYGVPSESPCFHHSFECLSSVKNTKEGDSKQARIVAGKEWKSPQSGITVKSFGSVMNDVEFQHVLDEYLLYSLHY